MEEPAATESNGRTTVFDRLVEARAAVRRQLTGKKFVFTDDSKHGKTRNKFVAGARRGLRHARRRLGVGAQKLSQKIKQIIRPLEMLQFVAILFMNVAHGLTSSDFATFRRVFRAARLALVARRGERGVRALDGPARTRARTRKAPRYARHPTNGGSIRARGSAVATGEEKRQLRKARRRKGARRRAPVGGRARAVRVARQAQEGLKAREALECARGYARSFSSQEDLRRENSRKVEYLCREGRRDATPAPWGVPRRRGAPDDPDPLVCLSKSLSDQVFQEDVFHDTAPPRASAEAAAISERAIALRPTHAGAPLAGRRAGALSERQPREGELSRAIKERCEEAIRLDPGSDLAMHVLGRYEHQMPCSGESCVCSCARYTAGRCRRTLENAEALFRRAIAVAPERLIHRVELGKLLLDVNRPEEALAELRLAVTLPREDINSEHERRDAVHLLRKHWNVEAAVPTFQDPPPTPPPRQRRSFEGVLSPRRSLDEAGSPAFEGDSARGSPAESGRESPVDSARGSPG